jgi:hypothetical protein
MPPSLLLVTGAGRSGTSTVAGALHHLGVHVPGPYLDANPSNPRGFYESRWSVEFHNRLLKRAGVNITDGRPEALEVMRDAVNDADAARLTEWLAEDAGNQPVTLVKDPRSSWTLDLWGRAAERLGLRLGFLVMLRHPTEVLGSRSTHYFARNEWMGEAGFATKNLAGWVNALLNTDRQTRDLPRAFVRYDDLLSDWRTTMRRAAEDLGLSLDIPAGTHPVDEFIDPQLSRHRVSWERHEVPAALRDLAESVWKSVDRLADAHGHDAAAAAELDAAREAYTAMYLAAKRLAFDATQAEVEAARRKAARAAREAGTAAPAARLRPSLLGRLRFPKRS